MGRSLKAGATAVDMRFAVSEKAGVVSGLLLKPREARALLVLAHGAGAGMRHKFMEEVAVKLAAEGIATLRYQFPYMEKGAKRPDQERVLKDTVRATLAAARTPAGDLPLFAGGKSMGGRMTSLAAAQRPLDGVRGLVFFGFPLHAAGRPGAERGAHLTDIRLPMLFLQGSRDALALLERLEPLCAKLGRRAELFVVQGGDHSFHMLKSAGRADEEVIAEVIKKASGWMKRRA